MTLATYVYALVRPLPDGTAGPLARGLDGAQVRVIYERDVGAVVSSVEASMFAAESLRGSVTDLVWLESTARAHDGVVDSAAALTTTIPLRLGTTCPDDTSVTGLLTDLRPAALRTFERLDGRREWGVQVFARTQVAPVDNVPGESGAGFLRRRRDELRRADTGRAADTLAADAVFDAGGAACAAARRHPMQDERLRADGRPMVLNAVFLVDVRSQNTFLEAVRAAGAGLGDDALTITGPWAPYSFAELDKA